MVGWTGFTSLSQFAGENGRTGLKQSLSQHFRHGQLWHHIIFMMLHCPPSRLSLAMYRFNQHKSVAETRPTLYVHSLRRHSGDFKPILLHNQSALRLIWTSDAFMALILFNNINFYVKSSPTLFSVDADLNRSISHSLITPWRGDDC